MFEFIEEFLTLTPHDLGMIGVGVLFFLALTFLLSEYLFKPYLGLIEARERATEGAGNVASKKLQEADNLRTQYEDKMLRVKIAAVKEKVEALREAKELVDKKIAKANAEAQEFLRQYRHKISRSTDELKAEITKDKDSMVSEIVEKLKAPAV